MQLARLSVGSIAAYVLGSVGHGRVSPLPSSPAGALAFEPTSCTRARVNVCSIAAYVLDSVVVVALLFGSIAHAQDAVDVNAGLRSSLYLDSDHNTIVTSSTDATARFDGRYQVGVHYLLDVVSSASIDVVTQSSISFEDTRHEIGGNAGYRSDDGTSLIAGYSHSTENDWQSHNVSLSGSIDVMQRNLTLAASIGGQTNRITRTNTFGFEERLRAVSTTLSASYIATPVDLLHAALFVAHYDGFQASPYRYLTIDQFGYAETVPDQRTKVALVLRHHRSLSATFALRSHGRLYADTYGVTAVTLGTEIAYEQGGLDLSGFVRGYAQSHASFYQQTYRDPQRYMTLDKELSTFLDAFVGGAIGWSARDAGPFDFLRVHAKVAANYFHFVDFVRLPSRYGLTATLGISGEL